MRGLLFKVLVHTCTLGTLILANKLFIESPLVLDFLHHISLDGEFKSTPPFKGGDPSCPRKIMNGCYGNFHQKYWIELLEKKKKLHELCTDSVHTKMSIGLS